MAKVQARMATEVALDLVQASTAIKNLTSAVSSSTSAWKAQEAYLRSVGDSAGAARAKYTGLGEAMDAQRRKIEALQDKQRSMTSMTSESAAKYLKLKKQIDATQEAMGKLDTSTEAGKAAEKSMQATIEQLTAQQSKLKVGTADSARQYLNFGKQIDRAKAKLASMGAQQQRAAQQMDIEDSGVKKLSSSMRVQEGLVSATVERLKAQGQSYQALQTSLNGARQKLSSLTEIQRREIALLDQTKQRFGESSEQYAKQATEVQKLGTRISETRQQINELDGQLGKQPTAWNYVRNSILGVDSAEKRAKDSAINFGTVLKANIFGGWIQTGFSTLTAQFKSIITNGTQAAKAGAALEARWKNIGVSAGNIKQLSEQVGDLKTNTYLSAQSVNALQTRFYGMTHSISQTKALTQTVGSLTDKLKLTDQQANAFAGGLSRVESSGKVTSLSLGRLEKQAPGLTAAMQEASGMSKKAFNDLVSSGKMTSEQFNQLMTKASGDYKQNSEAFGQTSGGAMHKLQAEWVSTQAKLAKPLLKVSSTGLNELSDALNNKQTQQGLQVLAKGLADSAVNAAKFIGFLAQHQNTVKIFGGALLGLAVAFKGMQAALIAKDTISGFVKMVGKIPRLHTTKIRVNEANSTKDLQNFSRRVDRIPRSKTTTVRANTTAATNNIQKVGTTARIASTTSKLSFATIGTAAKTAGTTISLAFRANPLGMIVTGVQLAIAAFQLLYQHSAKFRKFVNGIVSGARKIAGRVGRWFGNMAKSAGKNISNMALFAKRGWNNMNRTSQQSSQREIRLHNQMAQRNQRAAQQMWSRLSRSWLQGWNLNNRLTRQGVQQQIQQHRIMSTRIAVFNTQLWNRSRQAFTKGWNDLHNSTINGTNNINNEFNRMKDAVGQRAQQAMNDARNHFRQGYSDIRSNTSGWRGDMANIWSDTRGKIGNIADNLRGDATNKFSDMHSKLNDLTNGGLGKMEDTWHDRLESIAGVVSSSGKHIWQQFVDLLASLARPFKDLINDIAKGINWVLDHVGGDGKLGEFNFSFGSYATGTPDGGILHDQVALLNDGSGPHYQEMVHRASTGETFMLPAKRNMLLPLQKGDEVLDGERSHKLATMMQMPIPHANGAIGDFFSGLWNGAKELEDIAEDALKDVVGFGKSLFTHFVANVTPKSTDSLNSGLKFNLPGFYAEHLKNWLKKQLDDIHSADSPAGTMSKEAFAKAARRAAESMHQSLSAGDIDRLYWQAYDESTVNPAQGGGIDDHDGTGRPIGLFQFKLSTWNSAVRAMGGRHSNIHSAVDQIAAVLADRTWRSDLAPIGVRRGWTPHGYANGGIATTPSIFGEAGAEMAIPLDTMKSTRAWQLMKQVVDYYAGSSNQSTQVVNQTDLTPLEKRFDAALAQNQQLISLIEQLIGVTDSANNPTARYRRTQRDINLAQAQSLTGI
ncbi:tape measure protein [Lactobacillus reuteri]|uniref:tape measure protein n=1 Tax=Limosilactobacillus reuteri TaxID=1598 RepID=UPI00146F2443|nr:tape measure protein [Limosilactobacillus reuteri]NMV48374.1 tape measure protein [Limosilactobacillus reuteri]NMV50007.1 tape measure protein [Limosilactobacillus reuteri]NMV59144.1 tape measure protein [Limosilactobacillus reuteri]NMV60954.1 tape measure protein [Limosilactobacillus reuteri]NMV62704.1 tape measure protein [Limosilactobacillus reuteri]